MRWMRWLGRYFVKIRMDLDVFPPMPKPLMRGWSHAVAAVVAVVAVVFLLVLAHGIVQRLTFLLYGATLVLLLGVSAIYHMGSWPTRVRKRLQTYDHANIFLFIAGSYTPVAAVLLTGAWRDITIVGIWTIAAAGVLTTHYSVKAPRGVIIALYIGMGWTAVVEAPQLFAAGGAAILLIIFGGVAYSLGALVYATKWPNPWPKTFGYHEIFHLAVVAASAMMFVFMVTTVVPYR